MRLNTLANNVGAKKNKKRLGRGIGSGKGKTCGRGVKGQKARSGVAIKGFEGGQMPIIKRLPKRGFNCPSSKSYQLVKLKDIESLVIQGIVGAGETITKQSLFEAGFVKNPTALIKLLANCDKIEKAISVQLDAYSQAAKLIIEKAGGQIL